MRSILHIGFDILTTVCPHQKVQKTLDFFRDFSDSFDVMPLCLEKIIPDYPARPEKPILCPASHMPKRSTGTKGKAVLLHALAHIELNAIDLAWDMIVRFGADHHQMPRSFYTDWLHVASDEARHFQMIDARLQEFNVSYGDFPAHDSLWDAAFKTKDNLPARLAIVPMVLEARGLDVTPLMIEKFKKSQDNQTVSLLEMIYKDEIYHVHIGVKWFSLVTQTAIDQAENLFHTYLQDYFRGVLIPPFNVTARTQAGMPQAFYENYTAKRAI